MRHGQAPAAGLGYFQPDTIPINSALCASGRKISSCFRFCFENQVKAVIELSSSVSFTTSQMTFLDS